MTGKIAGMVHGDPGGRYLGLHVRFEKDMIAHSACYYGGGRAEKRALAAFRAKIWRYLSVVVDCYMQVS